MTDRRSQDCITELCSILKSKNMEWKVVAPYMLAVRRKLSPQQHASFQQNNNSPNRQQNFLQTHSNAATVVQIHLLRVQEKHDKGFVVDFFFAKGCPMAALEMTIEIWRELLRRVG